MDNSTLPTLSGYQLWDFLDGEKRNLEAWISLGEGVDPAHREQMKMRMIQRFETLHERYALKRWQHAMVRFVVNMLRGLGTARAALLALAGKMTPETVERTHPVQAGISGEANKKGNPHG